jgi:hypothetical protein
MALADSAIGVLKPRETAYEVADEKGLYLLVTPAGGRLWRLKFRTEGGVEKKLSPGAYPDLGLKDARELRDSARSNLARGIDPTEKKRRDKQAARINAANTFSAVAKAYIDKNRRDGLAGATVRKREWLLSLLEKTLGGRPVGEIEPFEVLDAVRPYEAAKNDEKAHRTLQFVGQVFRFAIANQLAKSDPTRDLRGALASRNPKHHAAILEPKRVGNCCAPSTATRVSRAPCLRCNDLLLRGPRRRKRKVCLRPKRNLRRSRNKCRGYAGYPCSSTSALSAVSEVNSESAM